MTEPQSAQEKKPTLEQRLSEIASKSNLTLRDLKNLVFQYQREQNKSCEEEIKEEELLQKNFITKLNGTRADNERMKVMLEHAELLPLFEALKKGKYPKKKRFLIF